VSLQKKVINGLKWTALSSVFSVVISIARIAILARLLDKSAFGIIAIVMFILGVSRLFMDMGISVAILHKQNISDNQYSSLYCFNLLLGICVFILISAIAPWAATFYNEPELVGVIPLMGLTVLLAIIGLQHKVIERKELNFKFIEKIEISSNILAFIIAVGFAYNSFGVYSLVYSALGQYLFANTIYTIRGLRLRKYTLRLKRIDLKPFLAIGGFQAAGQFLNYFSGQIDTLLIGKLLGMQVLGGYNLAKSLAARPVGIINPIINKVAAPVLSQMQNDETKMESSYLKLIKVLSLINFPIYFGAAVLSQPIIELLYGSEYSNYSQVFMWMCFYMLFRSVLNPIGSLVVAKGRTDLEFYWNFLVLFSTPIVVFVTAKLNINTLAFGLALLMFVYLFISYFMVIRKILDISLLGYLSQMKYALVFSCIMSIVVISVHYLFNFTFVGFMVSIGAGVLSYVFLVYMMGLRIDKELFEEFYKLNIVKKFKIKPF
jgi:O-antigen/teichoic acid export membrane protein